MLLLVSLALAGVLDARLMDESSTLPTRHFDVSAAFVPPAKPGGPASISVRFGPRDPDVHINEEPAPRLVLEQGQRVLVDKQAPPSKRTPVYDPETAKYLDTALPVAFPVALSPAAPKGTFTVAGTVAYFYCSKREGWCRKGSAEVEVAVTVP